MTKHSAFLRGVSALVFTVVIVSGSSAGVANASECDDFFELYRECYNLGQRVSTVQQCSREADKLWHQLLGDSKSSSEDEAAGLVADICEAACQDSADGHEKIAKKEFEKHFCE